VKLLIELNLHLSNLSAIVVVHILSETELLAQIEFTEWTPDGHLRYSKIVGLREDKAAREVVWEG
jgi:ATP-dependent DNA ligase